MIYLFWVSALVLFLITMLALIFSGLVKKWTQRFSESTSVKLLFAIPIIVGIVGGSLISGSWFGGTFDSIGSGNLSKDKTATCGYCGRSWEAGDSGGNFKSIAKTNLCKNCYNNYKQAQDALGK